MQIQHLILLVYAMDAVQVVCFSESSTALQFEQVSNKLAYLAEALEVQSIQHKATNLHQEQSRVVLLPLLSFTPAPE